MCAPGPCGSPAGTLRSDPPCARSTHGCPTAPGAPAPPPVTWLWAEGRGPKGLLGNSLPPPRTFTNLTTKHQKLSNPIAKVEIFVSDMT